MRRFINQKVNVRADVSEIYSHIFMELEEAPPTGGMSALSKITWHLEDELRHEHTLCGKQIEGSCIDVSPALAMLGKPCPDCKRIVREWIKARENFNGLIKNDNWFRRAVHGVVPRALFDVNKPKARNNKSKPK